MTDKQEEPHIKCGQCYQVKYEEPGGMCQKCGVDICEECADMYCFECEAED